MFVKINDIDVNATLISTFYKSESEPYQITYYMMSGPTLVEEFSNASDMNDKYELVSELSIGSGGGGSANVYTYKGSCLFANLPSENEVGDVWNVEDDFTLDGKNYPAGTNVAWDGTDWDALAGSFSIDTDGLIYNGTINVNTQNPYSITYGANSYRLSLVNYVKTNSVPLTAIKNALNSLIQSGYKRAMYTLVYSSGDCNYRPIWDIILPDAFEGTKYVEIYMSYGDLPDTSYFNLTKNYGGTYEYYTYMTLTFVDGLVDSITFSNTESSHEIPYLRPDNGRSWTPTGDYNPVHKKYVDDTLLNIAPLYDATATYNLGDLVIYNALLYKCTTAIAVAEAWDSTHWTRTTVFEVLGSVNTALSALTTPGNGGGN